MPYTKSACTCAFWHALLCMHVGIYKGCTCTYKYMLACIKSACIELCMLACKGVVHVYMSIRACLPECSCAYMKGCVNYIII